MYYIHKHEVQQSYGGAEEGGWWYEVGEPVSDWEVIAIADEEDAFAKCRELNALERERREREEDYEYTSVLSYRSTFYAYDVQETPVMTPYPNSRPHYE